MQNPPAGATAILAEVAADAEAVAARRLQPACQTLFVPTAATPRGVLLGFHGFTAGSWQFSEFAVPLAAAGLHVYAPRLPGHGGVLNGLEDGRDLPKGVAPQRYGQAADTAMANATSLAQAASVPLYIFGFSMGGAMALDLVLRTPQAIAKIILLAPLLVPQGVWTRRVFRMLYAARFLGVPWVLDHVPVNWGPLPQPPPGGWVRPGHWFFSAGQMYAAGAYAYAVANRANRQLPIPMQVILTANDPRCDAQTALQVLRRSPTPERSFMFPAEAGVPHAMLTHGENPNAASRARITEITLEFLLGGAVAHGAITS